MSGDHDRDESAFGRWRFLDTALTRIGAIATLLAVIVAIYFGVTSRQAKQLEVRYLAKLSLVTAEAISSGKVKVSYNGTTVTNPTKISGMLTNVGGLPIEARDIELPVTISFSPARLLEAEVTKKNPSDIKAECVVNQDTLQIKHGLLNPGDSIEFGVLCDGDPGWPMPAMRITGITKPTTTISSLTPPSFRVALVVMPRPLEYLVLVVASIMPLVIVAGAVMLLKGSVSKAFVRKTAPPSLQVLEELVDDALSLDKIADKFMRSPDIRVSSVRAMQALGPEEALTLADDPEALAKRLVQKLGNEQDALRLCSDLAEDLRATLRDTVADALHLRLFFLGSADAVRDAVLSSFPRPLGVAETPCKFLSEARVVALRAAGLVITRPRRRVDMGALLAGLVALALGIALSLILAGSWRAVLAGCR